MREDNRSPGLADSELTEPVREPMSLPPPETQRGEAPTQGGTDHKQQGWGCRFLVFWQKEVWLGVGIAKGLWKLKLGPMSQGGHAGGNGFDQPQVGAPGRPGLGP